MPTTATGGGYSGTSSTGRGRGCDPMWLPPLTGWRPRRGRRARAPGSPAFAPMRNRRRSSPPIPTQVGRAPGSVAAPLRHRAGPRAGNRLRMAGGQCGRFGFVQRYSWEAGTTASTPARRRARRPGTPSGSPRAAGAGAEAPRRVRRPARLRPGSLSRASAARGRPLERLRGAARRPADGRVQLQSLRVLAGGPRASPSSSRRPRPPTGSRPLRPGRRDRRPAHLMSDLIRQLGSPSSPSPPTTPARPGRSLPLRPRDSRDPGHVSRILALLGGAGALASRARSPVGRVTATTPTKSCNLEVYRSVFP